MDINIYKNKAVFSVICKYNKWNIIDVVKYDMYLPLDSNDRMEYVNYVCINYDIVKCMEI